MTKKVFLVLTAAATLISPSAFALRIYNGVPFGTKRALTCALTHSASGYTGPARLSVGSTKNGYTVYGRTLRLGQWSSDGHGNVLGFSQGDGGLTLTIRGNAGAKVKAVFHCAY